MRITILSFLGLAASALNAQGIRDSLFLIDAVEIREVRIFNRDRAGMKETDVDTVILSEKALLSLSELLSENTSIFIKEHGRGALATASFRGSAPSHTQVYWNGININSPMAGMVDFSLIPVYLIDQLNLKHGSASMAHGAGGIGGSIQIGNAVGWDNRTTMKYLQGLGSYRTFDEFLQLGAGNSRIQFRTRLYHNYSRNDYPFINKGIGNIDPVTGKITHPLVTNENADYRRYGWLQEVYIRPLPNQIISLRYWGQHTDRTIPGPTSYEGPDNSNLNDQKDLDHRVVADWNYYGEKIQWMVRSGFARKRLDYTLENRVPGLGLVPAIISVSRQEDFYNTISGSFEPGGGFSIESSVDINFHDVTSHDSVSQNGYDRLRIEQSLFLAVRKNVANRLNLNLMLRQQWIDRQRKPFSPYLGFDLRLIKDADLILKGNIAKNYHEPSLNDLYWQPGGNPDLMPEEGTSVEAGLEYQMRFPESLLRAEWTLYRSDIDNWIIWVPSFRGFWEPRNISRVLSSGMEFALLLEGNMRSIHYRFSGNYAFTRSVNYGDPLVWGDQSYGKQLVYIPEHSGNLMWHLEFKEWFMTYQYNAYSERYTTTSNDLTRRDWLYPYYMNNISAGREFNIKGTELSAEIRIYNLFNETYHSVLYRPMPGRNYSLLLMMKI